MRLQKSCLPLLLRYFFLICLLVLGAGCENQGNQNTATWRVGTSADNPPFAFIDVDQDGKICGFEIDLAYAIADICGKKAVIKDMDFCGLIASLQYGKITMALSAIESTPQREKNASFSIPYYNSQHALLSLKSAPIKLPIPWDHQIIGVQLGSSHEAYLKKLQETTFPDLNVRVYTRSNEMREDLLNKRLTGIMVDQSLAKRLNAKDAFVETPIPHAQSSYAVVFPKNSALVAPVNQALKTLQKNGKMLELLKKWGLAG